MGAYGENLGFNKPQRGNLSNYGKDPQHAKADTLPSNYGKWSGDGSEGAPQTFVRVQIELSYDTPRPDPDGKLRQESGAAIRRALEAKLTSEGLAAQLGDATVTLRTMVMRQEDSLDALGQPVSVTVSSADTSVKFEPADAAAAPGVEAIPAPSAEEARPGFGGVPLPSQGTIKRSDDSIVDVYLDDDEGTAPNAGSAS